MEMLNIDDEVLSAWLDGELDAAQAVQVEAWLRDHPDDAARVQRWRADGGALRERLAPLLHEPVPDALRGAVLAQPGRAAGWRLAAAVAGLLLTGGLAGAGLMWQAQRGGLVALPAPGWTQRATVAHAVYAPEVRHPVEVDTTQGTEAEQRAQEEHLSRWLTKRLGLPVKLFDLRAMGFELVGGRLLPDAKAPSAQLMYQNASGQRVTVYLRKPEASTAAAFRYERQGDLGMFYWVDGPGGYALVGPLPREQLLALAESIYRQGQAAPAR